MKKVIAALVLFVTVGIGSGCGKDEDNTATLILLMYANNKFAGNWTGTWASDAGENGTATVSVSTMGQITGTITNTALGETVPINSGSITNSGSMSITYTYSTGTFRSAGTVTLDANGVNAGGTLTVYEGMTEVATTFLMMTKI